MPWARLDDKLLTNVKVRALSAEAFRVWVFGLVYCQSELTDGFIPKSALTLFGVPRDVTRAAHELCTAIAAPGKEPLWRCDDYGYYVHDYLAWNESRDAVMAKRKRENKRQQSWRLSRRDTQRDNTEGDGVTPMVHSTPHHSTPGESPSDSPPPKAAREKAALAERFNVFWTAYPKKQGKGDALKAWGKLRPSQQLLDKMLSAIEQQKDSRQWREDAKFIPNPSTWLNQLRWEDELEPAGGGAAVAREREDWVCRHVEQCSHRAMCQNKKLLGYPERELEEV
jgi:hypothetical protein